MKTLAAIGGQMVEILRGRDNVKKPRYRAGVLSWLIVQSESPYPVWMHITNYSGQRDVIRFRNDIATKLPKSQWAHPLPPQFSFEMTALSEECNDELLLAVIEYSELAQRQPKSGFDRHPPEFPCGATNGGYGWTKLAWETMINRSHNKRP